MEGTGNPLMCGTVAGMASVLADYPLDTLKARMQTALRDRHGAGNNNISSSSLPNTYRPTQGVGIWRPLLPGASGGAAAARLAGSPLSAPGYRACLWEVWRADGLAGFYRGMSVPLAAQGAETAILFTTFNAAHAFFAPVFANSSSSSTGSDPARPVPSPVLQGELWCAAAVAGAALSVVLTPVEFVKTNMQVGGPGSVTAFSRRAYAQLGPAGFYTGFVGTLARAVAGNVAYFLCYKQLLYWAGSGRGGDTSGDGRRPSALACVLAGGVSGVAYWTVAYPCDVAKTNMQARAGAALMRSRQSPADRYWQRHQAAPWQQVAPGLRGLAATVSGIYCDAGIGGLYRGWRIAAARAFVSSAVVFSVYERLSCGARTGAPEDSGVALVTSHHRCPDCQCIAA